MAPMDGVWYARLHDSRDRSVAMCGRCLAAGLHGGCTMIDRLFPSQNQIHEMHARWHFARRGTALLTMRAPGEEEPLVVPRRSPKPDPKLWTPPRKSPKAWHVRNQRLFLQRHHQASLPDLLPLRLGRQALKRGVCDADPDQAKTTPLIDRLADLRSVHLSPCFLQLPRFLCGVRSLGPGCPSGCRGPGSDRYTTAGGRNHVFGRPFVAAHLPPPLSPPCCLVFLHCVYSLSLLYDLPLPHDRHSLKRCFSILFNRDADISYRLRFDQLLQ